jgi:hypothetical protein
MKMNMMQRIELKKRARITDKYNDTKHLNFEQLYIGTNRKGEVILKTTPNVFRNKEKLYCNLIAVWHFNEGDMIYGELEKHIKANVQDLSDIEKIHQLVVEFVLFETDTSPAVFINDNKKHDILDGFNSLFDICATNHNKSQNNSTMYCRARQSQLNASNEF